MFGWPEPIETECDAPPYRIVQACESLGFQSPLDVRWQRMSHFHNEKCHENGFFRFVHKLFSETPSSANRICHCGEPVPVLEKYAFTLITAKQVEYRIGQCRGCQTVFWDEA